MLLDSLLGFLGVGLDIDPLTGVEVDGGLVSTEVDPFGSTSVSTLGSEVDVLSEGVAVDTLGSEVDVLSEGVAVGVGDEIDIDLTEGFAIDIGDLIDFALGTPSDI